MERHNQLCSGWGVFVAGAGAISDDAWVSEGAVMRRAAPSAKHRGGGGEVRRGNHRDGGGHHCGAAAPVRGQLPRANNATAEEAAEEGREEVIVTARAARPLAQRVFATCRR